MEYIYRDTLASQQEDYWRETRSDNCQQQDLISIITFEDNTQLN